MAQGDKSAIPSMMDAQDSRPKQYGTSGVCKCGVWLSRYNPYDTCGSCRIKAASLIPVEIAVGAEQLEKSGFEWERFPKRERVYA